MNKGSPRKRKGPHSYGGVAQLGEHLPCKQGVRGSNPLISSRNFGSALHLENCISETHQAVNHRKEKIYRFQKKSKK